MEVIEEILNLRRRIHITKRVLVTDFLNHVHLFTE